MGIVRCSLLSFQWNANDWQLCVCWLTGHVWCDVQAHSQDFTLGGGTEAARVHFYSQKKLTNFFLVVAHRTLLVERTVLLYWINQAQWLTAVCMLIDRSRVMWCDAIPVIDSCVCFDWQVTCDMMWCNSSDWQLYVCWLTGHVWCDVMLFHWLTAVCVLIDRSSVMWCDVIPVIDSCVCVDWQVTCDMMWCNSSDWQLCVLIVRSRVMWCDAIPLIDSCVCFDWQVTCMVWL